MRLLPRTLFGQILLALCAGLIAAQAAGIWLTLNDRAKFGEGMLGAFAAQRIAGVISILDKAEPGERNRLVHALNVPPTHVNLDEPWKKPTEPGNEDANSFIEKIEQELERPAVIQVLSIKRAEPRRREDIPTVTRTPETSTPARAADANAPTAQQEAVATNDTERRSMRRTRGAIRPVLFVVGQARLADGAVVTFRHSLPEPGLEGPLRLLGLLAILGISVALLSAWAVRRLTLPLASLADAATGLARNLERPPLPETGPLEVAKAARAFNAMQRDIKRYLETRAHALAAVSHDLRLPITRLRLRIERIAEGELRSKMESDLSEMDEMIGNTLEFLRAGSTGEKASLLDINALIESVTEDMITIGAQIRQHGQAAQPMLVRPQALRRCLTNLLENARRYGGGSIDISISEHANNVEIRIDDRGPGIPQADLERVFEPYVRIESSRAKHTGGSGLGLAIARAIARAHDGDVRLELRAGGGISAVLTIARNVNGQVSV
ncbi:MAG TPA: ATP-binding protein [Burkholderiaceae bacterium]|jgi:signal transduction histidine kinase|nr:ATP-binding protein [Burkholderiaceae bacterium]